MSIEHFSRDAETTHEQIKPGDLVVYTGLTIGRLLYDDHLRVIDRYEALEPYNKDGCF